MCKKLIILLMLVAALVLAIGCNHSPSSTDNLPASPTYGLKISKSPPEGGSVEVSPSGGAIPFGAKITLTAVPATGYVFDHWEGDASGTASSTTVIMDGEKQVSAYFRIIVSKVSVAEAKAILDSNEDVVLVDVRSVEDYQVSHIAGAISIPAGDLATRYREITVGPRVLVYARCH